ncbi:MAG: NAD(+) synthase [Oligoflexales bacterium]|nr:NAD(+) synthase [Oligoflexales bacterium]
MPRSCNEISIAAISLNQTPVDFIGNKKRIIHALAEAKRQGLDIVCFQELVISGYACEDWFLRTSTAHSSLKILIELVQHCKPLIAVLSLPVYFQGALYNCVAVVRDGEILGLIPKKALAREGVYYEPRWFKPWPRGLRTYIEIEGRKIPFGDYFFSFGGVGLGVQICEEAWVADNPLASFAHELDIVVNPNASHYAQKKYEVRVNLVREASRAMHACYVYANPIGIEAGHLIFEGGNIIACDSQVIKLGQRFSFKDMLIDATVVELARIRNSKLQNRSFEATESENSLSHNGAVIKSYSIAPQKILVKKSHAIVVNDNDNLSNKQKQNSIFEHSQFEEFLRAACLGVYDYLRKSRSKAFVLPLSGGSDSSCCAVIIAQAIYLAYEEKGLADVCKDLGLKALNREDLIKIVLHCVYLQTKNNSVETLHAAQVLAQELGAHFYNVNVEEIVGQYESLFSKAFGQDLQWKNDDITKQNLQARVRAPWVWILANKIQGLLISTSNRSEASVGYSTMDGDMAGGFAPLAGVSKSFILEFLQWHASGACKIGFGKVSSLKLVLAIPPSAELRPLAAQQRDEKDLMPYDVLDFIEELHMLQKIETKEILTKLILRFPQYNSQILESYLNSFLTLWQRSQWKRERIAPSLHLAEYSEAPRHWARYPIFSGNE